jgi:type I restriction enzyme S subunit
MDWISESGTPWVKISDATGQSGKYISHTKEFIRNEGRAKSTVVYPGDFIVSNSATPGLPKFMQIEACIHDGWLLFRNFKGILPEFLYYRILNDRKMLVEQGNGSVFTNLKTEILKNHEIALPTLAEQSWIAKTLSEVDDLIESNRQISSTLEQIAQAIFKSWFVDFDPVQAKARGEQPVGMDSETAALFPDSFEVSELGAIPSGWTAQAAGELFDMSIGRTPPRKEPEWFCLGSEGVPWVSIRDMGTFGVFSGTTSEGLTEEAVSRFKVPVVPADSVLMSFKLTVGKLCITDRPVVTNEAIAHFKQKDSRTLGPEFTFLWLKQFDVETLDSTSSIATATNSGAIRNINFLVPSDSTLAKFEHLITPIFSQIKTLGHESQTLIQLRDSLLPRLISGELEIPAELLEA